VVGGTNIRKILKLFGQNPAFWFVSDSKMFQSHTTRSMLQPVMDYWGSPFQRYTPDSPISNIGGSADPDTYLR